MIIFVIVIRYVSVILLRMMLANAAFMCNTSFVNGIISFVGVTGSAVIFVSIISIYRVTFSLDVMIVTTTIAICIVY